MPAETVMIQKIDFALPFTPYTEGHVLNANEANALNQTWAENLRNNFSAKVKAALESHGGAIPHDAMHALQAEFTEYANSYAFAQRTARAPSDPVGHEAHKLAKGIVVAALRKKGIDLKTFPEARLGELISGLLEKRPEIREEAERRIEAAKAVSNQVFDLMETEEQPIAAEGEPTVRKPRQKRAA